MANRALTQFRYSLEKRIVDILATIDFNDASAPIVKKFGVAITGGAGTYSTTTAAVKGLTTVARATTGKYTFTFDDRYVRLVGVDVTFVAIDAATMPKALNFAVLSDTIATTKTVVLGFGNTANSSTLVDLGANDRVQFTFRFVDSTP